MNKLRLSDYPSLCVAIGIAIMMAFCGLFGWVLYDGITSGSLPYHGRTVSLATGAVTYVGLLLAIGIGLAVLSYVAARWSVMLVRSHVRRHKQRPQK